MMHGEHAIISRVHSSNILTTQTAVIPLCLVTPHFMQDMFGIIKL